MCLLFFFFFLHDVSCDGRGGSSTRSGGGGGGGGEQLRGEPLLFGPHAGLGKGKWPGNPGRMVGHGQIDILELGACREGPSQRDCFFLPKRLQVGRLAGLYALTLVIKGPTTGGLLLGPMKLWFWKHPGGYLFIWQGWVGQKERERPSARGRGKKNLSKHPAVTLLSHSHLGGAPLLPDKKRAPPPRPTYRPSFS